MDMVYINGKMGQYIKECINQIKRMVLGSIFQEVIVTKDNGEIT
jgi:hypothetical protein